MAKKQRSSPSLADLADESVNLIEELGSWLLREWTIEEWEEARPWAEYSRLNRPDRQHLLGDVALRLSAWAELHKTDEERSKFVKRMSSFLRLLNQLIESFNPATNPLIGRYLSPAQRCGERPITLLQSNDQLLAKLHAAHLSETLQTWAKEMRRDHGTENQDPFRELREWAERKLAKKEYLLVKAIIDSDGWVSLDDCRDAFGWSSTSDAHKSAMQRVNAKLRDGKQNWKIAQIPKGATLLGYFYAP